MRKNAQNLVEYFLIFSLMAVAMFGFAAKFDFKNLKNYIFMRPANSTTGIITIEPMTGN